MKNILLLILILSASGWYSFAEDTIFIKVHFLYGSKPRKEFRESELKWFGGKMGGHVGIETDSDRILNFVPSGKLHKFSKSGERHSQFVFHTKNHFYSIFGEKPETVKQVIFTIPITARQKEKIDSIARSYLSQTPYDYAFFGMRCSSAAYEILGKLDILPSYSITKTYLKIFYPKKLRKRLFQFAEANHWKTEFQQGSSYRIWDED